MTDIEIKYEHGSMVVHLENFLSDGKISKVRKLLKVIRQSYTPECEDQIKEFVTQRVTNKEQFHSDQVALAGKITNIESNIDQLERRLKGATISRNAFKKSTPIHKNKDWEMWNEQVSYIRESLRESKKILAAVNREYKQNIKDRSFYKKVIEEIT